MFDRPSINLGRIAGGDALNRVPDECTMWVDVRYLPGQEPEDILSQVREIPGIEVTRTFIWPTVAVSRSNPYVRALRDAVARSALGEVMSVGRDGASDAAAFIQAGIPAVEYGPVGAGHHGPEEWVSLSSLARYRRSLGDFVRALPMHLEESSRRRQGEDAVAPAASAVPGRVAEDEQAPRASGDGGGLRAIEGGLA
jgi:succinyl-diaminopimelate desuccinylase